MKFSKMVHNITTEIREISAAVQEITSSTQHVVDAVHDIDAESQKASGTNPNNIRGY